MVHDLAFNDADWPNEGLPLGAGAALIHVSASAQQTPGALHSCPVCGQPYTPACLVPPQAQRGTPAEEHLVLLCLECGTYAVGLLDAQDEEKVPH